jgi:ribosomal protein S18 acetylase RimI-like enzyme
MIRGDKIKDGKIKDGEITLRPAEPGDDDLLLRLYASTRAAEMTHVPWTPEQKDVFVNMQFVAQKQHYGAVYPNADHRIICWKEQPAGRLYLDRNDDAFHILDITVLPELRNTGIGSQVLRGVMEEARTAGKPVTIFVETYNPSVRLFERLGFRQARTEGIHYLLQSG